MRIITGSARGTKLYTLDGMTTRPTSERAKEAVFSILMEEVAGAVVLDMFAGSGQLGLEALSRGADSCLFCEADREAQVIVKKNIEKTHMEAKATLLLGDALLKLSARGAKSPFTLAFLDPPYALHLLPKALKKLHAENLLAVGCVLVCESAEPADVFMGDTELASHFAVKKLSRYGIANFTFLEYVG